MSSADTWAASQFYNLSQAARPKMLLFRAFSSRTAAGIHLTHLLSLLILKKYFEHLVVVLRHQENTSHTRLHATLMRKTSLQKN